MEFEVGESAIAVLVIGAEPVGDGAVVTSVALTMREGVKPEAVRTILSSAVAEWDQVVGS